MSIASQAILWAFRRNAHGANSYSCQPFAHGHFRGFLTASALRPSHALCKVVIEPVLDTCHVAVGAVGVNGVKVVVDGNIPHAVLRKCVVDI